MFRDVPGSSGMFREVPGCSMLLVLSTAMFDHAYSIKFERQHAQMIDTVWPLNTTSACLVTKQCLIVFGCQTFPILKPFNILRKRKVLAVGMTVLDIRTYLKE